MLFNVKFGGQILFKYTTVKTKWEIEFHIPQQIESWVYKLQGSKTVDGNRKKGKFIHQNNQNCWSKQLNLIP